MNLRRGFTTRVRRLGWEMIWVGTGQGVAVIGAVVGIRLLTGVLSPEVYGELALALTAATLAQQIVTGPLSNAFMRFFAPACEAGELVTYLSAVGRLLAKASVLLVAIFGTGGAALLILGYSKWLSVVVVALALALLSGYNSSLDCMQNASRQRPVVALHQGAGQLLRFLAAFTMVKLFGEFVGVALSGFVIAAFLILISQYLFFRRRIIPLASREQRVSRSDSRLWQVRMVKYGYPFAAWGLFTWAQLSSDRWALQTFSTTREVGLYAVVYQLGFYPFTLLAGILSQLVSPIIFSRAGNGEDGPRMLQAYKLCRMLLALNGSFCGAAIAIAFFAKDLIFSLLVHPSYREVAVYLPLMAVAGGLFATGQIASVYLTVDTDTRMLIPPKVITAVLGITGNFIGVYFMGLKGVVLSLVLFGLLYLIWILKLTHAKWWNVTPNMEPISIRSR